MKLRTRFLFLLLILAMLCSLLPQFTLPARGDNPNAGSCGEKLSWYFDLDSGTLTIIGSGEMEDFGYQSSECFEDQPWAVYRELILTVCLPEGLTRIGNGAFYDCRCLAK